MDLYQLNSFLAVARTLNFSEAARQNFLSQSTVSRYIGELEKELNVKLFLRSRRDVQLTREGSAFLSYAKEAVEAIRKAEMQIRQMQQGSKGRIAITIDAVSGWFAQHCLELFVAEYPGITVDITELGGRDNQLLSDTSYDFHFMLRDMLPEREEICSILTHQDHLCLVVKKTQTQPEGEADLRKLAEEKFILLSEGESPILYMEIMDLFRSLHLSPPVMNCYDTVKTLLMGVRAGLGMTILPAQVARMYSAQEFSLIPIGGVETGLSYVMAYQKEIINPAAQLFLELVQQQAQQEDEEQYYL